MYLKKSKAVWSFFCSVFKKNKELFSVLCPVLSLCLILKIVDNSIIKDNVVTCLVLIFSLVVFWFFAFYKGELGLNSKGLASQPCIYLVLGVSLCISIFLEFLSLIHSAKELAEKNGYELITLGVSISQLPFYVFNLILIPLTVFIWRCVSTKQAEESLVYERMKEKEDKVFKINSFIEKVNALKTTISSNSPPTGHYTDYNDRYSHSNVILRKADFDIEIAACFFAFKMKSVNMINRFKELVRIYNGSVDLVINHIESNDESLCEQIVFYEQFIVMDFKLTEYLVILIDQINNDLNDYYLENNLGIKIDSIFELENVQGVNCRFLDFDSITVGDQGINGLAESEIVRNIKDNVETNYRRLLNL